MIRSSLLLTVLLATSGAAQTTPHTTGMAMDKPAATRSTSLTLTGLSGMTKTLTLSEFAALPHVSATVHNAHSNEDETYSGVPVSELLKIVKDASAAKTSANMQVVIAGATDNFHVVLTLCDTNPECRSGQAIVADVQDGKPIEKDGAFKLVLTEDKKPARWARNLQSLTVRSLQ